jgi:DNA (cytosine-5)-methyltransferase 1
VILYPLPQSLPVTVRQAIGHLQIQDLSTCHHRKQLIDAWNRCPPGKSLRKAVPTVSSFESVRLHPDKPSTTQTANHFNWHYAAPRYLTIDEMALIGSFPVRFSWPQAPGYSKNQIGNSVPPLFMRAIARHIRLVVLPATRREDAAA